MNNYGPLAALLSLWFRLPTILGDKWPSSYWRIMDWLRALQDSPEDDQVLLDVIPNIADFLGDFEEGQIALNEHDKSGDRGKGSGFSSGEGQDERTIFAQIKEILNPTPVTRYTDIFAPSHVCPGQRFPLVVGLVRSAEDAHQPPELIQAKLNQLIKVVLQADGPDIIGEPIKDIRVTEGDSEPAVFYLRASQDQNQNITIDFFSESNLLASVKHQLVISEKVTAEQLDQVGGKQLQIQYINGDPLVPDLIWYIHYENDSLKYMIIAPHDNPTPKIMNPIHLDCDPEAFRYRLIEEIENLSEGKDVDGLPLSNAPGVKVEERDLMSALERIGYRLYDDLFNDDMRREYSTWEGRSIRTVLIVSDEPWIPWELVKPYDDNLEHDFFCVQYELSRLLTGDQQPVREILIDKIAIIQPDDSGLKNADAEHRFISSLAGQFQVADHSPIHADYRSVFDLLEGDQCIKLWHFACHGKYETESPGNSPIILQNNRRLRPNDFSGKPQRHLKHDRPFVFLNACQVGQSGFSLTGLGGWGKALVQNGHVSGLIAPFWSVDDRLARKFAEQFYTLSCQPGMTVGKAMRLARLEVRKDSPSNPTWLAYSLYAHPNARIIFKPNSSEGE